MKHVTQQQKQKTNQKIYDEKKIEFLQQSPINCINENSSVSEEIEDERVLGDGKDSITIHGSQRKASSSFIPLPSPSRTSNKSSISALSSPAKGNDTTLNTTVSNIPIFARNRSSREELLKQRKESSADRKRSSALIYSGQNGSVAAAESGEIEIEIEDGEDGQDEVGARSKDENGMSRDSADGEEEDSVDDDTVNDSMNTTGSHIPASGSHIPATSSHIPATGSHIPSTGSIHSITKDTKKADYTDFEIVNNEEEEEEEEEVEEEEEHDALSDSLLPLKGLQSHIDDFGELIDGLHTEIETADSHDVEDAIGEHTHSVAAHSGEIDYDLLADSLTLPQSNRGGVDYSKQSSSPMNKINSNITAANLRGNSTNIIPSDSSADRVATEHLVSKVSLKNQSNLQQPKKRLDRGQIMSGGVVDVADMLRNFNSNNGISNDGGKNDKKSSMYGNGSTKDGHAGYSDFQYTDIYGAKSGNADLVQYPINEIHIASVSQKSQEAGMQNKIHHDSPSTSIPPSVRDLLSLTPLPGSVRNSQNNNGAYNGKNNKKKNNNENELRDEVTAHEVVKEEQQGREMMGRNVEVVRRRQLESEVDADRGGRGGEEGEEELEEIETSQYLVQQERYNSERRKRKEEQKGKSTFKDKSKNGLIAIESRILKKFEKKIENKISDGRKRLEKIKVNNISKVVNKDKVSEGEEGKNAEERDIVKKEISPKNRKLSRSSREQEEEEEALMEELLELEKRQKKSIKELQKITETDHDSISKNKSRSNRSNCYDDSNSLSQSDKEGSTNPYRGTPGRSGNSSRPAAEREKQNKLAFGPGARDVRKVADYRAFADHAAVARVSASHNTRAGAGNLGKERDKERSPIQVYVSRDSNARNERRQRRILRERGSEIDDEEDNVEEDNDDDMQGQQKSHRSTDSNSRRHENGRLRGSDSEKDRETERDKDIESERGRLNRAGLRGIPESRQLLAPLSSHIDGDGDTGGGGEGYLSEYQRKNVKIRVKNLNRRHSEMVPDYHSDDESQQNSIFKSALSKGREGGIEEDKVFLPALRPPPAVYQMSQQHPLDSNRHSQREREKEKKGRLIKASSAPSRLVQGGTPVNDSAAFESESVSTLPPPVRVSHDYGSSNANLLRPLQHGLGTGFGSGRKVR